MDALSLGAASGDEIVAKTANSGQLRGGFVKLGNGTKAEKITFVFLKELHEDGFEYSFGEGIVYGRIKDLGGNVGADEASDPEAEGSPAQGIDIEGQDSDDLVCRGKHENAQFLRSEEHTSELQSLR